MVYNKISNLFGKLTKDEIPKFTTVKWIEIFDQSNGSCNLNIDLKFKTPPLTSDLCNFNEAYIVVTGKIKATGANFPNIELPGDRYTKKVSLKNSAPFFNFISKINSQLIEDAQDLDIVTPMYNLLYYSKNFRKTTGSFWNYYPDIPSSRYVGDEERTRIFFPIGNSESFDYKTKLVGSLPKGDEVQLRDLKIVLPFKNLSNFIFNLIFLMINTEIELILKWSQNCALITKATRE